MPSPFPGMDPYLEDPARWGGVHSGLIYAIHAELNRQLPTGLVAEIDQYVWVADEDGRELLGKPDAFVPGTAGPDVVSSYPADPTTVTAPTATVTLSAATRKKSRIVRIVTADGSRVLTVIELLSPSNKNKGDDRDAYLAKRREYFAAGANLVEIDLLRDGDRLPMGRTRPATADYHVLVTRAADYPVARVWSFSVREPVPVVPVPLDSRTPAAALDIRRCLDRVYEDGRYGDKINYARAPSPALSRPDAAWAAELLKTHPTKT